jgi:hypothetical protein
MGGSIQVRDLRDKLASIGFSVSANTIYEKDLFGEQHAYKFIHAVSRDESLVLTIRIDEKSGMNRLRILFRNKGKATTEVLERLEQLGLHVYVEEDSISATVTTNDINTVYRASELIGAMV